MLSCTRMLCPVGNSHLAKGISTTLGGGTCLCGDNGTALTEGHPGAGAAAPVLWDGLVSTGGTLLPAGPTAAHTGLGMGARAPWMGPAMLSPRYS